MYGRHCIITTRTNCHQGPFLTFDRTKDVVKHSRWILVPLIVSSVQSVVSSLVVKWNAILSLVRLDHLRLGAWSSRQVRVSCTGGEMRRSGGEIVLRKRGDTSADAASVLLRGVVIRLVCTGVEGRVRAGRSSAVEVWNTLLGDGWLPVDWLHTVFEPVRWLELPLANDGPNYYDTTDRSS